MSIHLKHSLYMISMTTFITETIRSFAFEAFLEKDVRWYWKLFSLLVRFQREFVTNFSQSKIRQVLVLDQLKIIRGGEQTIIYAVKTCSDVKNMEQNNFNGVGTANVKFIQYKINPGYYWRPRSPVPLPFIGLKAVFIKHRFSGLLMSQQNVLVR